MAENDELFTALKMFKAGVQEYSLSRALAGANQQVQEIKGAQMKEEEKRNALQSLSNQLVMQMGAIGAPVSQIQAMAGAIAPKQFANADQVMLEGRLTGSNYLMEQGKAASMDANANNLQMQHDSQKFQSNQQAKQIASNEKIAGMHYGGQKAASKLTDTQINAFTNAIAQEKEFTKLIGEVEENPGLVGPLDANLPGRGKYYGKDFAKFKVKMKQLFNQYRTAVTGAGASVGELKMLMEAFPDGSESEDVFKEKAAAAMEIGRTVLSARTDVLEAAGKDVSKLRDVISAGQGGDRAPGATPIIEKTLKDGRRVKVRKRADGKWEEVK